MKPIYLTKKNNLCQLKIFTAYEHTTAQKLKIPDIYYDIIILSYTYLRLRRIESGKPQNDIEQEISTNVTLGIFFTHRGKNLRPITKIYDFFMIDIQKFLQNLLHWYTNNYEI